MIDFEQPTPHKKRSSKKGKPRSDHKHQYEAVLVCDCGRVYPAKRCTLCSYVRDVEYFVTRRLEGLPARYLMLNTAEVLAAYSDRKLYDMHTGMSINP